MSPKQSTTWTVVTGATGGLGQAVVERLASLGWQVIATARDTGRVVPCPGSGRVECVELDVTDAASIARASHSIKTIVGDGELRGLVNMAGILVEGPIEATPADALRHQLDVNVIGPFALTRALLPLLRRNRGRVVNIGAISAHLTVPFYGPIAASKAAMASLNDAMRLEFAPLGVSVVLVEPGAMRTGIFAASRSARDAVLSAQPELELRYRPALDAMDHAFDKAGADDPLVVANAVVSALEDRNPKPRVVVGKGTRPLLILAHLPIRIRDKLVNAALGLKDVLQPAR